MDAPGQQLFWIVVGVTTVAAIGALALRLRRPSRMPVAVLAAALALPALTTAIYRIGSGPDAGQNGTPPPLARALSEHADVDAYARGLRAHLERQPRDARSWVLYGRMQAELDRHAEAALAFERALALSPRVATDPAVWCEYADALGMTQGGRLAGKPQEFIGRALMIEPGHVRGLEMAGSAEYEQGRYQEALGYWRPLLEMLKPGTRMHRELAAAILRAERLAEPAPAEVRKSRN